MFIQRSQILIFLTIFFISLPTSFAGLTYQQIVLKCQNEETACVIAVAGSDHSLAVQSAVRKEDAMQCAISALGSQVCQYTKTGWVWVGCGGSILGIKFHNFNDCFL